MELEIDFSTVTDLNSMHEFVKEKFGFPDFYGKNADALIDCLTSLRYPQSGMTNISIGFDEVLILKVKSLPIENLLILGDFLGAVEWVNQRYIHKGQTPPIHLVLI